MYKVKWAFTRCGELKIKHCTVSIVSHLVQVLAELNLLSGGKSKVFALSSMFFFFELFDFVIPLTVFFLSRGKRITSRLPGHIVTYLHKRTSRGHKTQEEEASPSHNPPFSHSDRPPSGRTLSLRGPETVLTCTQLMGDILYSPMIPQFQQRPSGLFLTGLHSWIQSNTVTCCTWLRPDSMARLRGVWAAAASEQRAAHCVSWPQTKALLLNPRGGLPPLGWLPPAIHNTSQRLPLSLLLFFFFFFSFFAWKLEADRRIPAGVVTAAYLHRAGFTIYLSFSV